MSWYSFSPYVPVAERRAKAARALAKLSKKTGQTASPVLLAGRKIASTFWGKAWCDNLEAYSDFENRLPRGRTYVRNGSVVHLEISEGKVTARVSGSSLYKIEINIKPLAPSLWKSIQTECAGKIDSLIELLQGKLSSSVMQIVTRPERGLFPTPKEIELDCSCPDWADLCKHVAASLYGVGARLDQSPELLFLLRGVDPAELISQASAAETVRQSARAEGAAAMSEAEIADVFGIELAEAPTPVEPNGKSQESVEAKNQTPIPPPVPEPKIKPPKKAGQRRSSAAQAKIKAAADSDKPSVQKMSAAARVKIAAAHKPRRVRLKRPPENKDQEDRIIMEVVVDAYNEEERAMGWYCYAENNIAFPFKARCSEKHAESPLKIGEAVEVTEMADTDDCAHKLMVLIKWDGETLAVPLSQLEASPQSNKLTHQVLADWHYWVTRGYCF